MKGRSLAAGPQRALIYTKGADIMWFRISTKLLSCCIINVNRSYFRKKLLGYWHHVEKKTVVGTKCLPASSSEEFRLNESHAGSLYPCWVPTLNIRFESRFFDPGKSKHFPVDKIRILSMINI